MDRFINLLRSSGNNNYLEINAILKITKRLTLLQVNEPSFLE